jgi:hypothetical protein
MGGLSFLLSFKVTWIKFVRSVSTCISHLDDATVDDLHKIHSRDNATQKIVEKRRRKENAGKTPRIARKQVKIGNENIIYLNENCDNAHFVRHPKYHKNASNNIPHLSGPIIVSSSAKKTVQGQSIGSTEEKYKDLESCVATVRECEIKTYPSKLVMVRICGGIIFITIITVIAIMPILISHIMKPDTPFVYYKPNCPKTKNHTKIIKVFYYIYLIYHVF